MNSMPSRFKEKKEGSRLQLFKEFEQAALKALPTYAYEVCEFKEAKVYTNSHITFNKHYYSVPYQYIGGNNDP